MFEEVIRELKRLEREGAKINVPITSDDHGYLDKECPRDDCKFIFKVKEEDWKNLFKDECVFCPKCREEAPSDQWCTTKHLEQGTKEAEKQAAYLVQEIFDSGLRKGASSFNRKQPKGSMLRMSMNVSGNRPAKPIILPLVAHEKMKQEIQCEECSARYAVIGCAYFCPCCGNNSVEKTFDASLQKVEIKLNNIQTIKNVLVSEGMKDEAEITGQSLIESCFSDCVVAFQRLAEKLYLKQPGAKKLNKNVFQRLQDGSELWKSKIGEGYADWLSKKEYNQLIIFFQQRHLLAHTEGIVDEPYIKNSGDSSYKIGQRIVIAEKDARLLLNIIRKLAESLRAKLK